ncbi:MAG: efflux RND transporter periplasmic adaptor subunit [Gammaproteobacteria bacterium]|nr:efflux RND transporter periplasmic adaptor subunit [Gammaproteobacteria bacterium]
MTDNNTTTTANVEPALNHDQPASGHKQLKLGIGISLVILLVTGLIALTCNQNRPIKFKTTEIQLGDLTIKVTATGKLEPVNQVEVGTEISGKIKSVDVDYNDRVKAGDVLARLDTDELAARLRQSTASLDLARARVKETEATVIETRNKLQRSQTLAKKGLCPQEDCDAAEASFKRAEAAHAIARAQVTQAQLDADRTALAKAVILSPINGIVLTRNVEPGQTVAASFQAPVLFILAEDLSRMELHVDIDEADVGQIQAEQKASFTVWA